MKSFIDKMRGKSESVEEKEINLDKVVYFQEHVKQDIEKELNKCNNKAVQYLKKHGTLKGFFCQFELRNCLDENENQDMMKTISVEVKQVKHWGWNAPGCSDLFGKGYGSSSTTVWDASSYSKQHAAKH